MVLIRASASLPQPNTRINQELKDKILQEALLPNSSISKIAKHYNLSPKSIYNWRRDYHKRISGSLSTMSLSTMSLSATVNEVNSSNLGSSNLTGTDVPIKPSVGTRGNFVELIPKSSISPFNKAQDLGLHPSSLSRSSCSSTISLSFNNFSLSLTGNFRPAILIQIINILEGSC